MLTSQYTVHLWQQNTSCRILMEFITVNRGETLLWKWGRKDWAGRIRWKESFSFFNSRGRVSDTDASFVQLTHDWGMGTVWCGKISPQKERRKSTSGRMNRTKRALKHASSVSVASSGIKICCSTCRESDVTVRSYGDPSPLRGGLGSHWLSTVGASRSFEVSPPHNVTNPSGVIILHAPPSPSFHVLRQMSEDPGLGTTTGKDGDCVDSASHGFSPHHFTLIPPVFSSVPFLSLFFSGFRLSLLILWLQDFYQGLAQTYATCHAAFQGHTA